jgi:anti-sigma regulatory factor (Ser/Thr protein kinase)
MRWDPEQPVRREVARRFSDEAVSAPLARAFTVDVLEAWGLAHLRDTAALLVTELITNAVAHTVGQCELGLSLQPDVLRLQVRDRSPRLPPQQPTEVGPDSEGGRGLQIVTALADGYGVEEEPNGKVVWVTLRLS